MENFDLKIVLDNLSASVKTELASKPEVVEKGDSLNVGELPITARKWYRLDDVVAVVADLKNSTRLGTGKHAASTASIYQASTGNVVQVFDSFDADFLAIQGDGAFALFWGEDRFERALSAGITIKTMSVDLVRQLSEKWPNDENLPETGFKVGIASGRILAKRIGTPRNPAQQEPVWAGKSVNFAAKAAQGAGQHELIVTGSVWDAIEKNDFLTLSCPCGGGPSASIWQDTTIDKLPDDEPEREGRVLRSSWCDVHGSEYCRLILAGETVRDEANELRKEVQKSQMRTALKETAKAKRDASRRRRLSGIR